MQWMRRVVREPLLHFLVIGACIYAAYGAVGPREVAEDERATVTVAAGEIAWLSDRTRPFVVVLMEAAHVDLPLGSFAHLGVACSTRAELERQCAVAAAEGCLREPLRETGSPAGCLAMLSDPDGHTLELSHGQEIGLAVGSRKGEEA